MNFIKERLCKAAVDQVDVDEALTTVGFARTELPGGVNCYLKKDVVDELPVTITVDDGNDQLPTADGQCSVTVSVDRGDGSQRVSIRDFATLSAAIAGYEEVASDVVATMKQKAATASVIPTDNHEAVEQAADLLFRALHRDEKSKADELVLKLSALIDGEFVNYSVVITDGKAGSVTRD